MINIIRGIFGNKKALSAGMSAIDKAIYTKEERADDAKFIMKAKQDFFKEWLESTKGQNQTRRFLAILFSSTFTINGFVWMLLVLTDADIEKVKLIQDYNLDFKDLVMLIATFYFAPHLITKITSVFSKNKKE